MKNRKRFILLTGSILLIFACAGPSEEEKAAREKAKQDSIATALRKAIVDSIMTVKIAEEEKARVKAKREATSYDNITAKPQKQDGSEDYGNYNAMSKSSAKKEVVSKAEVKSSNNRFIYFRDYWTYYDRKKKIYLYFQYGKWQTVRSIPPTMQGANLKNARKVDIDMNTDTPWSLFDQHKNKYPKNK